MAGLEEGEWVDGYYPLKAAEEPVYRGSYIYLQASFLRDQSTQAISQLMFPINPMPSFLSGTLSFTIKSACKLPKADTFSLSDPLVIVTLNHPPVQQIKSPMLKDTLNPEWDFSGDLSLQCMALCADYLQAHVKVYDGDNIGGDVLIAQCLVSLKEIIDRKGELVEI